MITRIIPRLDIKGSTLVKGIRLEGLRVLGRPELYAQHYYSQGADELFYMDIVATLYDRNSILSVVEATSREIFIPLTVGGGLRSLEDIRQALKAGADKVALNTAAIRRPELIREAAEEFGSSTIVLSIESKKRQDGSYEAYTDCGRERTGLDPESWAEQGVSLGAGEVFLTSVDQEGTGRGYDVTLVRRIAKIVSVPVVACGGAGTSEHVAEAVRSGADGVSLASMLHYQALEDHPHFGGGDKRVHTKGFSKIQGTTIKTLKHRLMEAGLSCRPTV